MSSFKLPLDAKEQFPVFPLDQLPQEKKELIPDRRKSRGWQRVGFIPSQSGFILRPSFPTDRVEDPRPFWTLEVVGDRPLFNPVAITGSGVYCPRIPFMNEMTDIVVYDASVDLMDL